MFSGASEAFALIFTPHSLLLLVAAALLGLVATVIPGLGVPVVMAVLIPLTFAMDTATALMFLVAIMGSGGFGGSITAIVMNVPGDSPSAATMMDGYPLAQQGQASRAIGAAATASLLGATFGVILLIASLPALRWLSQMFGPPELFAAALAAIALIGTLSMGSGLVKGMIAGTVGMLLGSVGFTQITGEVRYTFGIVPLYDGIPLLSALIGLFALPAMFGLIRTNRPISLTRELMARGVRHGVAATLARPFLLLRSSALGVLLGIIPGVGSSAGTWIVYYAARNTSRDPASYGQGNVEGVIAPEAARDAKEGGGMIPLLGLGVPSGLTTGILLSAFLIHGVAPGRRLFEQQMPLVWTMIGALLLANVIVSTLGLMMGKQLAKLTLIPARVLVPTILVLAFVGAYVGTRTFFGITVALLFGFLGQAMVWLAYPRPVLLVGMILLPIAENNFYNSLEIYLGSYTFLLRPLSLAILGAAFLGVAVPPLRRVLSKRRREAKSRSPSAEDGPSLPVKWELAGLLPLFAAAGAILWNSLSYQWNSRLFSQILLAILALLIATLSVQVWFRPQDRRLQHPLARDYAANSIGVTALWLSALPILIWLVGTISGIFLYVVAFIILFDRETQLKTRLASTIIAAPALTVSVHLIFFRLMGVTLPSGLFSLAA